MMTGSLKFSVPVALFAVCIFAVFVLAKGYGARAIDRNELVDENTLFAIASQAKTFTAAALAVLLGKGRLIVKRVITVRSQSQ